MGYTKKHPKVHRKAKSPSQAEHELLLTESKGSDFWGNTSKKRNAGLHNKREILLTFYRRIVLSN